MKFSLQNSLSLNCLKIGACPENDVFSCAYDFHSRHIMENIFFSPARPPNCGLPCDLSSLAGLVHLTCYPFPKASGQIPLQWRSLARELELPHGAGKFDKPMSRKYQTNGSYPEVVNWWIDISKKKVILWFRFYNFTNYILLFQAFHLDDLRHVFPQLFHHQSKPANISQLHLQNLFAPRGKLGAAKFWSAWRHIATSNSKPRVYLSRICPLPLGGLPSIACESTLWL